MTFPVHGRASLAWDSLAPFPSVPWGGREPTLHIQRMEESLTASKIISMNDLHFLTN